MSELKPYGWVAFPKKKSMGRIEVEKKPIVLCRDCKYWNAGTCLNDNVSRQIEDCGCYPDFVTDSNWFCAEGERR